MPKSKMRRKAEEDDVSTRKRQKMTQISKEYAEGDIVLCALDMGIWWPGFIVSRTNSAVQIGFWGEDITVSKKLSKVHPFEANSPLIQSSKRKLTQKPGLLHKYEADLEKTDQDHDYVIEQVETNMTNSDSLDYEETSNQSLIQEKNENNLIHENSVSEELHSNLKLPNLSASAIVSIDNDVLQQVMEQVETNMTNSDSLDYEATSNQSLEHATKSSSDNTMIQEKNENNLNHENSVSEELHSNLKLPNLSASAIVSIDNDVLQQVMEQVETNMTNSDSLDYEETSNQSLEHATKSSSDNTMIQEKNENNLNHENSVSEELHSNLKLRNLVALVVNKFMSFYAPP